VIGLPDKTRTYCFFLEEDMNRYLLKKALDQAGTTHDFSDIWETAMRLGQKDIFDLL